MNRRAGAILAGVLVAGAGILAPVPAAASPALEVWIEPSSRSLVFGETGGLVPGDVLTGALRVRNGGSDPAWITLGVRRSEVTSSSFLRALELEATLQGRVLARIDLGGASECVELGIEERIEPGADRRIGLALAFEDDPTLRPGGESAQVSFVVSMSDDGARGAGHVACAAGPAPDSALPGPAATVLPAAPGPVILLVLGAAVGGALLRLVRGPREHPTPRHHGERS